MSNNKGQERIVKCSFCGKPQEVVKKIIAGPGVYICDECIALCQDIIDEEVFETEDPVKEQVDMLVPAEIKIHADHMIRTREKLNKLLSEKTGQSIETIERDTERDHYMTAQEALEYGLIDGIMDKRI